MKKRVYNQIMHYSEIIRRLRKERKITQTEMGKVLGISQRYYCDMERNKRNFRVEDIIALAQFFELSTDEILGLKEIDESKKL